MKPFSVVTILLLLMLGSPLQAQTNQGAWELVTGGELAINDMVLDANENTIWIGTTDGLWRYDGRLAEQWDFPDKTHIRALWIDAQNQLWVGTMQGLVVLGPERRWDERLEPFPELVDPVRTLTSSANNGIWAGTENGVFHIDDTAAANETNTTPPIIPTANPIESIITSFWEAGPDDLWIGTDHEGLFHVNSLYSDQPEIREFRPTLHDLPVGRINALWADNENGNLWVGGEEGLCLLDMADLAAPCQAAEQIELQNKTIVGLFPDLESSTAVWAATFDDVTKRGSLWHYDAASQTLDQIHDDSDVRAFIQDREGQLWMGTTTGLWKRPTTSWRLLLGEQDGRVVNVNAITEDETGRLWVGSSNGLFWREEGGVWQAVPALAEQAVTCLWPDSVDGSLWACLPKSIVNISSSAAVDFEIDEGRLSGIRVNDIWQDSEETLWFATADGVWQKSGLDWQHHPYSESSDIGPANPIVSDLTSDGEAGLWAGTHGGLSHFNGLAWQANDGTLCEPPKFIRALTWEATHKRLWLGTSDGLAQCDNQGKSTIWTKDDQLIVNDVRALTLQTAVPLSPAAEQATFLWIGTHDGLNRANISEETIAHLPVVSFSEETGLPDNRIQALYTTQDGAVLLGTREGLWAYEPGETAPQVRLCYPECSNATYDSLHQSGQKLEIDYNDQSTITAVGGDLLTPAENLIYRFEISTDTGMTKTWSLDGVLPLTTDMLPAGDNMTVRAWAYDRDFNPSSQPASLDVVRLPTPLLLRPWFVIGMVLLILILGPLGYWQIRKFRLYGYRDLEVIVTAGAEANHHLVQFKAGGGVDIQEEHRLDWTLIKEPLSRIEADESDDELLRFMGRQLYDSLFSKEATTELQQKLKLGRSGIRMRLRFDNLPHLAVLPWELLHGGDELKYLTTQSNVALVRDYSTPDAQLNRMKRPLKLLLVSARPSDLPDIDDAAATELEAIKAFAEEATAKRVDVTVVDHATPQRFWEALKEEYDFIHFIGHGGLRAGQGVLYFEDDDGQSVSVDQSALATELNKPSTFTNQTPKLIFLNACRTAEADNRAGITGLATTLVTDGNLAAVIGMGYPIASESAGRFSQFFYKTLIQNGQVDYAVAEGRKALFGLEGSDLRDWATPRLYLSVEKGIVFDLA